MKMGRRCENPTTKEICIFRTVSGDDGQPILEMEYTIGIGGARVPEHAHPHATQRIKVLSGVLGLKLNGKEQELSAGMEVEIPPDTNHSQWNAGEQPVVTLERLEPPMEFEEFFEAFCRMGEQGQLKPDGNPKSFLQTVAWLFTFRETTSIAPPARYARLAVFGILYPFARMFGYKGRP